MSNSSFDRKSSYTVFWKSYTVPELLKVELIHRMSQAKSNAHLIESEHWIALQEPHDLDSSRIYFHRGVWRGARALSFTSITDAAKVLRSQGALWVAFENQEHRRQALIAEEIRSLRPKIYDDSSDHLSIHLQNRSALGGFTLLSRHELLLCTSIEPNLGCERIEFAESKAAPSRAYLKLWELFLRLQTQPSIGDAALDLGASPGGWTWALARWGCSVTAVDKAALAPQLLQSRNIVRKVEWIGRDAFTLPSEIWKNRKWICSDMIVAPTKLFELFEGKLAACPDSNLIATLKFKEPTDFDAIDLWASIPGSRCVHLQVNKHELTWILLRS